MQRRRHRASHICAILQLVRGSPKDRDAPHRTAIPPTRRRHLRKCEKNTTWTLFRNFSRTENACGAMRCGICNDGNHAHITHACTYRVVHGLARCREWTHVARNSANFRHLLSVVMTSVAHERYFRRQYTMSVVVGDS